MIPAILAWVMAWTPLAHIASAASFELDLASGLDLDLASALNETLWQTARVPVVSQTQAYPQTVNVEQQRLTSILHAFGYLAASVDIPKTDQATFRPVLGRLFTIGAIDLQFGASPLDAQVIDVMHDIAQDQIGQSASGNRLEALEKNVLVALGGAAFQHPRVVFRAVEPDAELPLATVHLSIDPGPKVRLGEVAIKNSHLVDHAQLAAAQPFMTGTLFHPDLINDFTTRLSMLPNITSARVTVEEADINGNSPVLVELQGTVSQEKLTANRTVGRTVMLLVLGLLLFRQLAREAWPNQSKPVACAQTFAVLGGLVACAVLVAIRAVSFL